MCCNNQMKNVSTCNSLNKLFKGYNFISNLLAHSKSKIVYLKSLDSREIIKILKPMIASQTSQLQIPQVFFLKTMLQQAVPRLFLFLSIWGRPNIWLLEEDVFLVFSSDKYTEHSNGHVIYGDMIGNKIERSTMTRLKKSEVSSK